MNIFARLQQIIKRRCIKMRKKNETKHLKKLRERNRQLNCSIICNNCIGGVIYHNLGMRFDSPTINLFIKGKEYLEFCKNLAYYSACDIIESQESMKDGYPVGTLIPKDNQHIPINVYFQHYKTFEVAKEKWIERFKRVNYDNIFFLWEFYHTLYDLSILQEFDALPLANKMIITHKNIPELKNSFCVSCYNDDKPIAKILAYDGITGKRFLDEFDYVGFINK